MSGCYVFEQELRSNQATPVFQAHGEDDFTVPFAFGHMTSKLLQQFNPNCDFKSYPNMAHSSCEQVSLWHTYQPGLHINLFCYMKFT